MLVTTCPGCDTTFKVTVAILEKASGQVRCGRCTRIFDANSSLREQAETITERLPPAPGDPAGTTDDGTSGYSSVSVPGTRWFLRDDPPETPAGSAEPAASAPAGDASPEPAADAMGVPAAPEKPASPTPPEPAAAETAGAETDEDEPPGGNGPDPDAATDWRDDLAVAPRRRSWPWAIAASLLTLTLAAQLIHAARSDLAALPGVGPLLISAYAKLGRAIAPPVALEQYSTLDLTAVAEPVTAEQGWLIIETRVQNRGPKVQPYPHILVRLLDRWQETIAGRHFAPDEYLVTPQVDYSRMDVGTTADVQFIIVDPGPNATGFELEFCTPVENGYRCETE